jgi:signal transduction histidine kinase/PAS domain-containing protein
VLAPLQKLGRQVAQIGRRGDLSERVSITGRDELGRLGENINQMLADLQQSQHRRQESEERFGRLVESMDDMVFTLDKSLTQINLYGDKARKLGLPESIPLPGSLEGTDLASLPLENYGIALSLSAETLRNHLEALRLAIAGQHLAYEWSARAHGQEINFQSVLSPVTDHEGNPAGVVGVTRDISGLKALENDLRRRVRDLNALNEISRVFLSQLDPQTIFTESCRLLVEQFGVEAAWLGIFHEEDLILRPQAAEGLDLLRLPPLIAQGKTAAVQHPAVLTLLEKEPLVIGKSTRRGGKIWETLCPAERGFDWLLALPVAAGESRGAMVVFSQDKNAFQPDAVQLFEALTNLMSIALNNAELFGQVRADQARLQALSQRLVEIQEEERREIALELHDEIGQLLTGLKIKLDAAGDIPPKDLPMHLEGARQLAEELIKKVRNLSLDLRPSMLDDLGLLPALLWHFDRYTSLTGIHVHFVQKGIEGRRFAPTLETTAYRVVQEGLTNVARHARVNEAAVRVLFEDQTLTIQIEDRGVGFTAGEALESGHSRGLLGIRERVAFAGGSLTIDSVPGWGTLLVVELPVIQTENGGKADDHDRAGG